MLQVQTDSHHKWPAANISYHSIHVCKKKIQIFHFDIRYFDCSVKLTAPFYFRSFDRTFCVRWNCSAFVAFPADSYLLLICVFYFSSPSNPLSHVLLGCFLSWSASKLYSINFLLQHPTDGLLQCHHWSTISRIYSTLILHYTCSLRQNSIQFTGPNGGGSRDTVSISYVGCT